MKNTSVSDIPLNLPRLLFYAGNIKIISPLAGRTDVGGVLT